VRSTEDDRSVLLTLTPAGRDIGHRIMTQVQRTLDAVLADWPTEDVDLLRRLLARLAGAATG
jgi:DNA-binding MarR family transcriptional regulator